MPRARSAAHLQAVHFCEDVGRCFDDGLRLGFRFIGRGVGGWSLVLGQFFLRLVRVVLRFFRRRLFRAFAVCNDVASSGYARQEKGDPDAEQEAGEKERKNSIHRVLHFVHLRAV